MLPYLYLYIALLIITILSFVLNSNKKRPFAFNSNTKQHHVLEHSKGTNRNNRLFYLCSIIVWLFVATREIFVGTDTKSYVSFFKNHKFWYNGESTDLLFEYLGRFLHLVGDSNTYFIFSTSTIYLAGLFFMVYKVSVNKPLSIVLFCIVGTSEIFFFSYLSMIRQATALSVYFIGVFLFFEKGKVNKYDKQWGILLYACSCLIHASCLFSLPILLLLTRVRITKKVWITLVVLTYIVAALKLFSIGDFLTSAFGVLGRDGHYSDYSKIDFGLIEDKGWFNMNLIPYSLIAILLLIMPQKRVLEKWYVQLFFYSVILNNIFSDNLMWSRLILYFSIFFIIAVPNVLNSQSRYWKVVTYSFIFIYLS
jgi:hypothetical protein